MARPKIYFKKRTTEPDGQLWLYYSYGAPKRLEYYTGLRIEEKYFNEKYWDSKSKKPIRSNFAYSDQLNIRLEEMMSFVVTLVVEEKLFDIPVLKDRLNKEFKPDSYKEQEKKETSFVKYADRVIQERKDGLRTIITGPRQGQNYKANSLRNPNTTLSTLKDYLAFYKKKDLNFVDVNLEFYLHYRNYILKERGNVLSSFATRIKDIKAFMNEALEDKLHDNTSHQSKRFITPSYDSEEIAMSMEEIKKLHFAVIPERYHQVRDLFLVGCYSALRFSDFSKLKIADIDDRFIRIKQEKTDGRVSIPIMKDLIEVLIRHNGELPKSCSLAHFNRTIKDIVALEEVGIDRAIGIDEDGELIMWSSLVSSHTCRRSYATNMFKMGIPNLLTMAATGHKRESDFLKYIRMSNEEKSNMLADWMNKLNI